MCEEDIQKIEKAQSGDKNALEELIEENNGLIWSIVKRFYGRGHEPEDLYQIGCLGFIKSIKRFNTDFEVKLSTYAVPYMIGEIKRYIRDDGPVKVSRELQKEKINKEGKEPKIQEIAKELNVDLDDVILAMEATNSVESIEGTKHINNKDGKSISLLDTLSSEKNEEETITFTFKNTGASKVVWFNYQCLCDAPADETQALEE